MSACCAHALLHASGAGGLPDLLLWRPADKSAKVVEVKGPRDRLSHQQRFWLAHMAHNTMQVGAAEWACWGVKPDWGLSEA